METFIKIVQLLASLSLLVIIHEFGHFIFAKIFKCRVEKFYLFFDYKFSLLKFSKWGTEFGIGWIPFGGYVKISGMVDESMDKDQLAQPAQPWEYRSKPAWQRFFIIIGGVLMNIILAIVIYIGLSYAYGEKYVAAQDVKNGYAFSQTGKQIGFVDGDKVISVDGEIVENASAIPQMILLAEKRDVEVDRNGEKVIVNVDEARLTELIKDRGNFGLRFPYVISGVLESGLGAKAGLMSGDSLVSINGQEARFFDQFKSAITASNVGDTLNLGYYRGDSLYNACVVIDDTKLIGVTVAMDLEKQYKISEKDYGFFEAIPAGFNRGGEEIGNYFKQLRVIFSPETGAYKEVGGFIAMGKIFPAQWSWYSFWTLTALISIMLAVLNILPIPALDGGHLLFIIYEMITRRVPSQKFMEAAQYVGFILILGLVIFANGNDIIKLFTGN